MLVFFFFSSIRRHTICALVTGVQTCALPISPVSSSCLVAPCRAARRLSLIAVQSHGGSVCRPLPTALDAAALDRIGAVEQAVQIGRASCRERVWQYV